jgi:hypothetical protein
MGSLNSFIPKANFINMLAANLYGQLHHFDRFHPQRMFHWFLYFTVEVHFQPFHFLKCPSHFVFLVVPGGFTLTLKFFWFKYVLKPHPDPSQIGEDNKMLV